MVEHAGLASFQLRAHMLKSERPTPPLAPVLPHQVKFSQAVKRQGPFSIATQELQVL